MKENRKTEDNKDICRIRGTQDCSRIGLCEKVTKLEARKISAG